MVAKPAAMGSTCVRNVCVEFLYSEELVLLTLKLFGIGFWVRVR